MVTKRRWILHSGCGVRIESGNVRQSKNMSKEHYLNYFPVLVCTTKLAQTTSQYYFVLHGLHKLLPSTTVYYKACTNYFPVLLCTTKLAQTTSQYYFALQSLHKLLPSTTLYYKLLPSTTVYYKACTNYFPVLLCTTKLAQTTSQHYCVLQSLHKALANNAKVWMRHVSVLVMFLLFP